MTTEVWPEPPGGYVETDEIGDPLPRSMTGLIRAPQRRPEEVLAAVPPSQISRPIDLAAVLDGVEAFLQRFVVFANDHQPVAVTCWVAHTHAIEAAETTPYLNVHSPTKRSGKSTLLDILEPLVQNPLAVANMSEAALFRSIQRRRPTLLFDEVDALFAARSGTDSMRGLLNAGHRRGRSAVRMGGVRMNEVQDFDTFCPKALAGIGRLPDTISDRSIPIALPRKKSSERVDPNRYRLVQTGASALREALEAWASRGETIAMLAAAEPAIPDINDRAADGWEPLLAIADEAGDDWPAKARAAAQALSGGLDVDESLRTRLLADLRFVFDSRAVDRLSTLSIVEFLVDIEDAPWAEMWAKALRDDPAHKAVGSRLARLLRDFGIKPGKIRLGEETANGYLRSAFEDAWERYLPAPSGSAVTEGNNGTSQVDDPSRGTGLSDVGRAGSASDQGRSVVPLPQDEQGADMAPGQPRGSTPQQVEADRAKAAAIIAQGRAQGLSDETKAVLLNTGGVPPPDPFKRWTGYAVRTVESST